MSRGIGGGARAILEDQNTIIYEYYCYNLNEKAYCNDVPVYDGTIMVEKNALVEPEIHEKIRKMPSGRKKLITKRIYVDVDYDSIFREGKIKVENSKYHWKTYEFGFSVDIIAMHLIFHLFREYQKTGIIPDYLSYHV